MFYQVCLIIDTPQEPIKKCRKVRKISEETTCKKKKNPKRKLYKKYSFECKDSMISFVKLCSLIRV